MEDKNDQPHVSKRKKIKKVQHSLRWIRGMGSQRTQVVPQDTNTHKMKPPSDKSTHTSSFTRHAHTYTKKQKQKNSDTLITGEIDYLPRVIKRTPPQKKKKESINT